MENNKINETIEKPSSQNGIPHGSQGQFSSKCLLFFVKRVIITGAYVKYGAPKAEACPIILTFYRLMDLELMV